jgi:hypothetical protein
MRCDKVREGFPDYLEGLLATAQRADIETHMTACAACREELSSLSAVWAKLASLPREEPGPASKARFQAMLEAYRQGMQQAERDSTPRVSLGNWLAGLWPRQPAVQFAFAVVLFAVGLMLGPLFARRPPISSAAVGTNEPALAQLRDEISSMRHLVTLALLQQPSASDRLRGVNWSYQIERPDGAIFDALLRALDSDPNVNVRLAAVDALHQFARAAEVRKGLLHSLAEQQSPLVQIELINLMVELRDRESVPVLRQLSQRPELNPAVREHIERGLQKLG